MLKLLLNSFISSNFIPSKIRNKLLRMIGLKIDETACISSHCFFGGTNIQIGKNSFINHGCFLDNMEKIIIGDNVSIGMRTLLVTSCHNYDNAQQRGGEQYGKAISIGNGSWIGANVTIIPGISVGEGCVIAAGSVVTKNCEPNCLYGGNPARKIKQLS